MKIALIEAGRFLLTPQLTIDRSVVAHGRRDRKRVLGELAVAELRQDAKDKGLDKMPMSEINRAVAAARRDLRKHGKRCGK